MKRSLIVAAGLSSLLMAGSALADVKIYGVAPLTGAVAAFGDQVRKGVEAAVADINAKGGVKGEKLVVEFSDDACDPKQGVSVANQLAGKKAEFVIGHVCSGATIAAADIYDEEGIVMVTPTATNPTLTEKGKKTIFRACGRDDQQGVIAGSFIADRFKGKRVAVLHDKQAYGKGLADEATKAMKAKGLTPVYEGSVTAGDKDYSALVSRLKNDNIDVVYYGGYHPELGLILRQADEAGLKAQFISGEGVSSPEIYSIAGKAADGLMFTFPPDGRKLDTAKDAVAKLRASGVEPEGFVLQGYAATQTLAQAMMAAKSLKKTDVLAAMRAQDFQTVLGTLAFDAKGDLKNPDFRVYVWKDGKYDYLPN